MTLHYRMMMHLTNQTRTFLLTSMIVTVMYVAAHGLVCTVLTPIQAEAFPDITEYASFFYLPHGIRVIATALLGARAVPALIIGEIAGNFLFWNIADPILLLGVSVIGGVVPWIGFEVIRAFGINAYYLHTVDEFPPLSTLLFAGLITSILNAFLLTAIFEHSMKIGEVTRVMAAYVVGDMTGLMVVVVLIRLALKLYRTAGDRT